MAGYSSCKLTSYLGDHSVDDWFELLPIRQLPNKQRCTVGIFEPLATNKGQDGQGPRNSLGKIHMPRAASRWRKRHWRLCGSSPLRRLNKPRKKRNAVRRCGFSWLRIVFLFCQEKPQPKQKKSHVARPCQTPTGGIIWPFPGHAIVPWNVPRQYKKQRATSRSCSRRDIVVLEGFGASFLCVIDLSISGSSCNDHVNSLL